MSTDKLFDIPHPAKYTDSLMPIFARILGEHGCRYVLDPFAGTGKVFLLERFVPGLHCEGVEIEPEWAAIDPRVTLGNALCLPWSDETFDAICTSPTYGNRMADHHHARDGSRRNTYTHTLGRPLHPQNSGAMQWGEGYRDFHTAAWLEARRVLKPGGVFVLNVKDHIRQGRRVHVTEWHVGALLGLGFRLIEHVRVNTPGNRHGANGGARIGYESIIAFQGES